MELNEKVKNRLREKGIKQTAVADALHMKVGTLNAILNGRAKMSAETLMQICKFIGDEPCVFLP